MPRGLTHKAGSRAGLRKWVFFNQRFSRKLGVFHVNSPCVLGGQSLYTPTPDNTLLGVGAGGGVKFLPQGGF